MSGVWMRLSNGREELIVHPDHVNRLLDEGGVKIPDPRQPKIEPIATVFEPAIVVPIETVFDEPLIEPLQNYVEPVEVEDVTPRKRGRQSKSQDV